MSNANNTQNTGSTGGSMNKDRTADRSSTSQQGNVSKDKASQDKANKKSDSNY